MADSPPHPPTGPHPTRVFGPEYQEERALRDGSRVRLRTILPSDKPRLVDGLRRMSPQSRYLRFFTDKERLSDSELHYLTEIDGESHFALGIIRLDEEGQEREGLGIGRFVRLPGEPTVAEPALAVLDDVQGQGLGRLLMVRLVAAAVERGIERFRCDFLAINQTMAELLRDVSPAVTFTTDGPVVTAEFPLPGADAEEPIERAPLTGPLFRWLRLVAEQVVELRRLFETRSEELLARWQQVQHDLEQRARRALEVEAGNDDGQEQPEPDEPDEPAGPEELEV